MIVDRYKLINLPSALNAKNKQASLAKIEPFYP